MADTSTTANIFVSGSILPDTLKICAELVLPDMGLYYCVNGQFHTQRNNAILFARNVSSLHVGAFGRKNSSFKFATHLSGIGINFANQDAFFKAKTLLNQLPEGTLLPTGRGATLLLRLDRTYPIDGLPVADLKAIFEGVATITTQIPWSRKARAVKLALSAIT